MNNFKGKVEEKEPYDLDFHIENSLKFDYDTGRHYYQNFFEKTANAEERVPGSYVRIPIYCKKYVYSEYCSGRCNVCWCQEICKDR